MVVSVVSINGKFYLELLLGVQKVKISPQSSKTDFFQIMTIFDNEQHWCENICMTYRYFAVYVQVSSLHPSQRCKKNTSMLEEKI
jgi:hypothetical protein